MASRVIYPPVVDSSMSAFNAEPSSAQCRIYFRLSKFNSSDIFPNGCVHVSIMKQSSGKSVVNIDSNSGGRYRSTGIILDVEAIQEGDLFYIVLTREDLINAKWDVGEIYKVQLRLSTIRYEGSSIGQAAWLNLNASFFSEWSTVCAIRTTGSITYTIPVMNIVDSQGDGATIYTSTLNVFGKTNRVDKKEYIHFYQFTLYDEENNLLEDSGEVLASEQDNDSFNYLFKTELEDEHTYKLGFKLQTEHGYEEGFYKESDLYAFSVIQTIIDTVDCQILTAETDPDQILADLTTVHEEEEEGRMGLKLFSSSLGTYTGNLCIRRSDSRTEFKVWEDIKIIPIKNKNINDLDLFYDYTIESGVWYKYAVQAIDTDGNRSVAIQTAPVMRNFEYSFLLGENNQQLKLMFDNNMGSFKYQMSDSVTTTIGGIYPVVSRNAATRYRTFPLAGLISFWMDENKLFCDKKVIYSNQDIVDLYNRYNTDNNIVQYDYIYERDFRQKVLDFLYDGEIKLFKSPTEGNILVRLTDVNCTPNQAVDRMLYSFNCTVQEMAEATMTNYLKYKLYEVGEAESELTINEVHLGQLQGDFAPGTNIIAEIFSKYDKSKYNINGNKRSLREIKGLKITFEGDYLRTYDLAGNVMLGFNILYNNQTLTIANGAREYDFDNRITFSPVSDRVVLLGDAEGVVTSIPVTVDFLYTISTEVYQGKKIKSRKETAGLGQIYESAVSGTDFYNEIYYKYYIEWDSGFRKLIEINSIDIEADPGAVFKIRDAGDSEEQTHEVNSTGRLVYHNLGPITALRYVGMRDANGNIDTSKSTDVLLNYEYVLISGEYA